MKSYRIIGIAALAIAIGVPTTIGLIFKSQADCQRADAEVVALKFLSEFASEYARSYFIEGTQVETEIVGIENYFRTKWAGNWLATGRVRYHLKEDLFKPTDESLEPISSADVLVKTATAGDVFELEVLMRGSLEKAELMYDSLKNSAIFSGFRLNHSMAALPASHFSDPVIDPSPELTALRDQLRDRQNKIEQWNTKWRKALRQPVTLEAVIDEFEFKFKISHIEEEPKEEPVATSESNSPVFSCKLSWDNGGVTIARGQVNYDGSLKLTEEEIVSGENDIVGTRYSLEFTEEQISGSFFHPLRDYKGKVIYVQ